MLEQLSKIGSEAIGAMKTSPALLALILLQTLVFGLLFVSQQRNQVRAHEREMLILAQCFSK